MRCLRTLAITAAMAMWGTAAQAGIYSDDLAKCLVDSSTKQDRIALVRWMFAAASSHPAVASFSAVKPGQLEDANKALAELFTRLLTDSCRDKAQKALAYEGMVTLQTSFAVLGQVAGAELFDSPEVKKSMSGLDKYLDVKKLQALGTPDPAADAPKDGPKDAPKK